MRMGNTIHSNSWDTTKQKKILTRNARRSILRSWLKDDFFILLSNPKSIGNKSKNRQEGLYQNQEASTHQWQ